MTAIAIEYELSDAQASQAVREDCIAFLRQHLSAKDLLVVLGSTGILVLAVMRDGHWLWWLAGLPAGIFVGLGMAWLVCFLWLPRAAVARLVRLPHRRVQVYATADSLTFRSATEQLEVAWSEVRALTRRPNFWLVCLKSGARIPVPARFLPENQAAFIVTRLAAPAREENQAG